MLNLIKFFFLFFFILFLFGLLPRAYAEGNSYITIINPQRISVYTKDYLSSFRAEYSEIESRGLPSTWLVTYDVLRKDDFVKELKNIDSHQELGIFLEVTPNFANSSGVSYNKPDSWHRASSLFLSGYSQTDRKKLIDKVFAEFMDRFGYYPKSVGSWWTDSYSLEYMKKKYNITSTLNVSDQYDLDSYQVWGTWWSVPYYPSKINAALPAQDLKNKLDLVTLRWASRDPLNGYKNNSNIPPSMYSTQDYPGIPSFQNLLEVYAIQKPYNKFGEATVGMEGDLGSNAYKTDFANQMNIVKNLSDNGNVQILTMKDFSNWYMTSFPKLSPDHLIVAQDPLGKQNKIAIWKQTPTYRVGLVYDIDKGETKVVDLRSYSDNLMEPNYTEPNRQINLSINLPFTIDSVILPNSEKKLDLGKFEGVEDNGTLDFEKDTKPLDMLLVKKDFPVGSDGIVYEDYSLTIPYALKSRLPFPPEILLLIGIVSGGIVITVFKKKGILIVLGFVLFLGIGSIILFPQYKFYISQTEYDALTVLKRLPAGQVLSYDKDCLKCVFTGQYKPAAAAGKKAYIELYSGKPVQIENSFLLSKSSQKAKSILKEKNIRYIYLATYGSYIENLPYLPEDLGLKRVYENANAEIWEIN